MEDYLVFVAVAALIAETALSFSIIKTVNNAFAIKEGKILPLPNFIRSMELVTQYALAVQILSWITIFSIKWSFLFYFRGLTHRLQRMEAWWWFIVMILAPITAMTILGPFIVCPHTGKSIFCIPKPPFMQYYRLMSLAVHCQPTPKFVRREHIWVYYTAASDVVTDIMRRQRQTTSYRFFF